MTIQGIKFKIGDRIRLTWLNTYPVVVEEGIITEYRKPPAKCCLKIEGIGGWCNARHPYVLVENRSPGRGTPSPTHRGPLPGVPEVTQ
jgi:hypothetical protein